MVLEKYRKVQEGIEKYLKVQEVPGISLVLNLPCPCIRGRYLEKVKQHTQYLYKTPNEMLLMLLKVQFIFL